VLSVISVGLKDQKIQNRSSCTLAFGLGSRLTSTETVILPIIFEALEKNVQSHWNQAVNGLTVNVRKMFLEMDAELFEECQRQYLEKEAKAKEVEELRELNWKRLADAAAQNGADMVTA
ncbi:serine/threonine protein phosphatase 2A 57 kDa regulatory subunit B beta-like protein, partial [Trifolium pratense]